MEHPRLTAGTTPTAGGAICTHSHLEDNVELRMQQLHLKYLHNCFENLVPYKNQYGFMNRSVQSGKKGKEVRMSFNR